MNIKMSTSIFLSFCVLFFNCTSFFQLQKPSTFKSAIAISVKDLTEKVKTAIDSNISVSNDLLNFCGMNRLYGYAIDDINDDIILIGGRMEPSNDITLDDFAISLRNVWQETTPPGCSIDPRPKEMAALDSLLVNINKWSDGFIGNLILSKWKKSAEFESVRIFGVPKNTSFAKAIIDADYLMKKISDGTHPIRLNGFKSFNQMMLEANEKEFRRNGSLKQNKILCRFWFSPDENKFLITSNALYLKNSSVKLLTEEEYWNENNEKIGKGNPHPVAEKFVKSFTAKYQAISIREPIYAQLETLFRMVAIQKILKEKLAFNSLHSTLYFWLNQYPITMVLTQDSVKAIYSFKRLYATYDDLVLTILSPMAGGVTISPEISEKCFEPDQTGFVSDVRNLAINSRPIEKCAYWYFDLPDSIQNRIFAKQL